MIWWHRFCSSVVVFVYLVSFGSCKICDVVDRCSCRLQDSGLITLWGIDDPNHPVFKEQPIKKSGNLLDLLLDYNPCTSFNEGTCVDDMVCVHNKALDAYHSAGNYENFDTKMDKDVVIFKYIGAKTDNIKRETEIRLKCDRDATTPTIGDVVQTELNNKTSLVYSFELTTHCACPGRCRRKEPGSGSNMSVGSILLTIFFVMLGAYFIFGHLFLKYHRNLDGESSIPNYEFWKELPTNVKEGFEFTRKSLCGTDESYENI